MPLKQPTKEVTKPKRKRPGKEKNHWKFTTRQRRFITLFEDQLKTGKALSMKDLLRKAGYSESSVQQYSITMQRLQPHIDATLVWFQQHRKLVQQRMDKSVKTATYAELTRSLDVTTHYERLLSGKSTHNFALQVDHRHRIEALIEQ